LDSVEIARRHRMVNDVPTPNFFEGMLMGNGDLGLCVTLRPDALGLHIGRKTSGTFASAKITTSTFCHSRNC